MLYNALAVLLLLGVTAAKPAAKSQDGLRIFYGNDTEPGEFPFMVSLYGYSEHFCGGSLISPRVVLTAAHCVDWMSYPSEILVNVGEWNLTEDSAVEEYLSVARVIIHPDWFESYDFQGDIALVILMEEVNITRGGPISPIALPENDDVYDEGTPVTLLGWGGTENGDVSEILQKHSYPISDQEACNETWSNKGYPIEEDMVCTGDPPLEGFAWFGDSGGPLVTQVNGTLVLVALTSWGSDVPISDTYDVNTNVWYYKDWIMENSDPSNYNGSLQLIGGDGFSNGVVVVDTLTQYGTICSDEIGPNEVKAICRYFGFESGIASHISDYQPNKKNKDQGMGGDIPNFGVSKMECSPNGTIMTNMTNDWDDWGDWGDCMLEPYPRSMPCFEGDQLAVRCSDIPWMFNVTNLEAFVVTTSMNVAKGNVFCSVEAEKYGVSVDMTQEINVYLFNVVNGDWEYIMDLKYKKNIGVYKGKIKPKYNVQHDCFVCYAEVWRNEDFYSMMYEESCPGQFEARAVSREKVREAKRSKGGK